MRAALPRAVCLVVAMAAAIGSESACAPIAGPVTVEALLADPKQEDGVRLGDVKLETVTDLGVMTGELFDVRGGLRMAGLTVQASVDAKDTFKEMVERCRGDGGNEFHPRMTFDGTRWVAEDLETLTAFTLFADLERAFAFAQDSGDDEGSAKGAIVGVTAEIVAADLFPLPILTSDNAAYAPPLDGWLTLSVGAQEGVPFAMSLPVLAHEFGHRLFFRNVFKNNKDAFEVWRSRTDQDASKDVSRANRMMQGIDEGLADTYSLAVTEDLAGIPRTFEQAKGLFAAEAKRRDLEGDFADAATYDNLKDLTLDADFLNNDCHASDGEDLYGQSGFNFYCLGTVLARALWDGSDRSTTTLRKDVIPAVIRAYAKLGDHLADDPLFDVDFFLQPLVEELPADRVTPMCDSLREKFASLVVPEKVPACP